MFYTIYKITNRIDEKIYIGCHKTEDLDDGYMGSGKILKRAINKHGIENFSKEILHIFDNPEDMFDMEATLVNEDFVSSEKTYNLMEGGSGGFDYINTNVPHNNKGNHRKTGNYGFKKRPVITDDMKKEMSERMTGNQIWLGKTHREESKRKIGERNAIHQSGSGNSQYGTMWITNEKENKKISKTDPIPSGWRKGRKVKV